jgi:hypothetical protein
MSGRLSVAEIVTRGRQAEDLLRQPVLQEAADELRRRSFELYLAAGDDPNGEVSRANAKRMVLGAELFLDLLREWVAEAREHLAARAEESLEDENA